MTERRQLLQESLAAIERLEARLEASERAKREPIAIVGAGCRYPGGIEDLEGLWRVLRDGIETVAEIPKDRWDVDAYYDPDPRAPGKMITRRGGFLDRVDRFDPRFFGISPREAAALDPQQRLLLETAYEALENAGIPTDGLAGSATGVFVGISTTDYGHMQRVTGFADPYSATGIALNSAAGRISFTFGLQGPCVAVDTACSSSLVAVHLACQSLRARESALALAGGVNVILAPDSIVLFSKWGMMAPDGSCKTFAATADGFVRAEGCAVVALKRLDDALAAGDPILAVIRGSAVNSDGRSSGLTVPNGPAQQAVLRQALASAALAPADLDYVEAHGTGTLIGDPIEVEAVGAVMKAGRPADRPLLIGSIKTNIGHSEAAAGLAGLLKVVASLRHEAIPPHLHFTEPNPRIPWAELPLAVPTTLTPWPRGSRPRRAGVSAFGISGTNAHVIVEEAPPRPTAPAPTPRGATLVPLSARDDEALRDLARGTAAMLDAEPGLDLADVAATAGTGRAHLPRRMAVLASSTAELAAELRARAASADPIAPARVTDRPRVAFLFTGQGAQYAGMGRGLYDSEPVFRDVIDRADARLRPLLARPLLEVLYPPDGAPTPLGETAYTQPALFALEVALAELWRAWGVTPAIVIGHSVGEYAAACVAGVFGFEDGLALIAERGRLMQALPAGGAMAAVFAAEERVAPRVARLADRLAIAGVNGPEETVVSGDAGALAELLGELRADGVGSRALEVSHAFHSPLLEPMLDALERRAGAVAHQAPSVPLVSNLHGATFAPGARPDGRYWRRHAREPVRFAAGVDALRAAGATALVEIGPHPVLLGLAARAAGGATWSATASLRRGRDDRPQLLTALAELYTRGATIRWDAVVGRPARRAPLPTYPFRRDRCWLEPVAARPPGVAAGGHPLLGERQRSPQPGAQFLAQVAGDAPAFLADHVIMGSLLMPATGYVELGLAAAHALGARGPVAIEGFEIEAPMGFAAGGRRLIHTAVEPEAGGRAPFVVRSVDAGDADGPWQAHAHGAVRRAASLEGAAAPVAEARARCATALDVDAYYARLAALGLHFGPRFHGLRSLHMAGEEAVGLLEVALEPGESPSRWIIHPALLDAAFHLLGAVVPDAGDASSEGIFLPIGIERIVVDGPAPLRLWATARLRASAGGTVHVADLRLEDETGRPVAIVAGLQIRAVTAAALARALSLAGPVLSSLELRWRPAAGLDAPAARLEGRVLLAGDRGGVAAALAEALVARGTACTVLAPGAIEALSVDALAAQLRGDGAAPLAWVVDATALDATAGADPPARARVAWLRHLKIAQATAAVSPRAGLCLLTRGAQAIAPGDDVDPASAALVGLARTAAAERAEAPGLRLDLDPSAPVDVRPVVQALAVLAATEPELGVRSGDLFAPRLEKPVTPAARGPGTREVLRVRLRGALDGVAVLHEPRRPPGPGEVEIAIRAAGLNFRDVLNALGLVPGFTGALGSECSGTIVAVGAGVAELAVGDDVVALAGDCLGSHVTAAASLVVRKPETIGFADAVTLPNTYLTAAVSFLEAGLARGQRVLVHAATGGVGLAALRLARRAGAQVIATAGSPEKRAFALAEGATHAFDSRSASFEHDVLRVTGGAGVDVVLSSLSGELIAAGMRALRPGGAFIEIGKKGIWTPAEAAAWAPQVRYRIVDLGEAIERDVTSVRALFERVVADVARGELAPLPLRAFALDDAVAAFRHMATARHIGKVVLVPAPPPETAAPPIRRDATYLVTGGLGGLGWAAAEWLAARGAGEIVVVGRRGAGADDAPRLAALRAAGASVTAVAADLGDPQALRGLARDVLAGRPPLRGILHAAGVLADAPLAAQDAEHWDRVAHGKVLGAWHLHQLAGGAPLDFFALFSSSSALFGSPGQANYAAANAFLDGLSAFRRARGLAATSLAWGAWDEVGMAARLPEAQRARLARLGMGFLDPREALAAMGTALAREAHHVAILALDAARVGAQAGASLRALLGLRPAATSATAAAAPDVLERLRAASADDRLTALRAYVAGEVARVLGFNAAALDAETPLSALGFDSLMAVQFKNRVQSDLSLELALAQLLAGPTVDQITETLAERLGTQAPAGPATPAQAWEEGSL